MASRVHQRFPGARMARGGRKLVRCGPVKAPEHSPNPMVRGAARIARARARFIRLFGDSASDTEEEEFVGFAKDGSILSSEDPGGGRRPKKRKVVALPSTESDHIDPKRPHLGRSPSTSASRERRSVSGKNLITKDANKESARTTSVDHSQVVGVTGVNKESSVSKGLAKEIREGSGRLNRPSQDSKEQQRSKDKCLDKESRSKERSQHDRNGRTKERPAQEKDAKSKEGRRDSSQNSEAKSKPNKEEPEEDPSQDEVRKMASLYTDELLDSDRGSKHKKNAKSLTSEKDRVEKLLKAQWEARLNRNKLQQQQQQQQQTPPSTSAAVCAVSGPNNAKSVQDSAARRTPSTTSVTASPATQSTAGPGRTGGPTLAKDSAPNVGGVSRKEAAAAATTTPPASTASATSPAAAGRPRIGVRPLLREPRLCLDKKQRCVICSVEKGSAGHLLQEYDQLICKVCFRFFSKFVRVPQHLSCNGETLGNCQLLVAPRCRACWAQSCVRNLQFDGAIKKKLQNFLHEKKDDQLHTPRVVQHPLYPRSQVVHQANGQQQKPQQTTTTTTTTLHPHSSSSPHSVAAEPRTTQQPESRHSLFKEPRPVPPVVRRDTPAFGTQPLRSAPPERVSAQPTSLQAAGRDAVKDGRSVSPTTTTTTTSNAGGRQASPTIVKQSPRELPNETSARVKQVCRRGPGVKRREPLAQASQESLSTPSRAETTSGAGGAVAERSALRRQQVANKKDLTTLVSTPPASLVAMTSVTTTTTTTPTGYKEEAKERRDSSGIVLTRKVRVPVRTHPTKRWENMEPTLDYPGVKPLNWSSLGEDLSRLLNIGLPVIVASPAQLSNVLLCFVCASSVKHNSALYCAMCCEPYHTFCVQVKEADSVNPLSWLCPKCQACTGCGKRDRRQQMLKCSNCRQVQHARCVQSGYPNAPSKRKAIWTCVRCIRCKSCDTNARVMSGWNFDLQLCAECVSLRQRGNFCPICERCYDADDYDIEMVECARCRKWVHAACENLSPDEYHLLSVLPDSDTFTCTRCGGPDQAGQRRGLLAKATRLLNHKCVLVLNRVHSLSPATMALAGGVMDKASTNGYLSLKAFCHDILQVALRGGVAIKPLREMLLNLLSFYFRDLNDMIDQLLVVVSPSKDVLRGAPGDKDAKPALALPIHPPSEDHHYARTEDDQQQKIKQEDNSLNDSFEPDQCRQDGRVCSLCGSRGDDADCAGRLLYLGCDCWGHANCVLWSAEVYQDANGFLHNVYMAMTRGRFLKCELCSANGATIGCCERNCAANYHFRCALRAGAVFCRDKSVFCLKHSRLQGGIEPVRQEELLACERPMYVDQTELKNSLGRHKTWSQGARPALVRVCIGGLIVEALGHIELASDFDPDVLVPVDFRCRRVFWSVANAAKRAEYRLSTRQVDPKCFNDPLAHTLTDHSAKAIAQPYEVAPSSMVTYDAERELDTRLLEELSRCVHSSNSHIDLTEFLESVTRSLDPDLATSQQQQQQQQLNLVTHQPQHLVHPQQQEQHHLEQQQQPQGHVQQQPSADMNNVSSPGAAPLAVEVSSPQQQQQQQRQPQQQSNCPMSGIPASTVGSGPQPSSHHGHVAQQLTSMGGGLDGNNSSNNNCLSHLLDQQPHQQTHQQQTQPQQLNLGDVDQVLLGASHSCQPTSGGPSHPPTQHQHQGQHASSQQHHNQPSPSVGGGSDATTIAATPTSVPLDAAAMAQQQQQQSTPQDAVSASVAMAGIQVSAAPDGSQQQQQLQQQHQHNHGQAAQSAALVGITTTASGTTAAAAAGTVSVVSGGVLPTGLPATAAQTPAGVHHHHHHHHGCAHLRIAHSCLGHQHTASNMGGAIGCVNSQSVTAVPGHPLTQQQSSGPQHQPSQQQHQPPPQQGALLTAPLQTLLKKRPDGTVSISVEQLNQLNSHLLSNSQLLNHPNARAAATLVSATLAGSGGANNSTPGTLTSGGGGGGALQQMTMNGLSNATSATSALPTAGGPSGVLAAVSQQHQLHHHHHHHHHHPTVSLQSVGCSAAPHTTTTMTTTTTPTTAQLLSPSGASVQLVQQANGNLTLLSSAGGSHLHLRGVGMGDVQGALLSPTGLAGVPGVVAGQLVNKVSPPRPKTILPKVSALPVGAGGGAGGGAAGGGGGGAPNTGTGPGGGSGQAKTVPLTKANLLAAAAAAGGSGLLASPTMTQALAQSSLAALNVQQQHPTAGLSAPQLLGLALPQQSGGSNAPCEVYEVPGGTIIIPKKGVVGAATSTPGGVATALSPQTGGLSYLGSVPLLGQLGQLAVGGQPWPLAAPPPTPTIQLIQTPTGQQAVLLNPFMPTPLIYPQLAVPQPNLLLQPQGGATLAQLVAANQQGARPGLVNTLGAQGLQMLNPGLLQKLQQQTQQQQGSPQQKSGTAAHLTTTKISASSASTTNLGSPLGIRTNQSSTTPMLGVSSARGGGGPGSHGGPSPLPCLPEKSSPSDVVSTTTQDLAEDKGSPRVGHIELGQDGGSSPVQEQHQQPQDTAAQVGAGLLGAHAGPGPGQGASAAHLGGGGASSQPHRPNSMNSNNDRYPEPDSSTNELPLIERMGTCSPLSLPPPQSPFSSSPSPSSSPCDQEDADAESILALLQKAANKIMDAGLQVEVADSCTDDEQQSLSVQMDCTPLNPAAAAAAAPSMHPGQNQHLQQLHLPQQHQGPMQQHQQVHHLDQPGQHLSLMVEQTQQQLADQQHHQSHPLHLHQQQPVIQHQQGQHQEAQLHSSQQMGAGHHEVAIASPDQQQQQQQQHLIGAPQQQPSTALMGHHHSAHGPHHQQQPMNGHQQGVGQSNDGSPPMSIELPIECAATGTMQPLQQPQQQQQQQQQVQISLHVPSPLQAGPDHPAESATTPSAPPQVASVIGGSAIGAGGNGGGAGVAQQQHQTMQQPSTAVAEPDAEIVTMFPVVPPPVVPKPAGAGQANGGPGQIPQASSPLALVEGPPTDRPYLIYRLESSDGAYSNESHNVNALWRDLFEQLQLARAAAHLDPLPINAAEVDGYAMMGLRNALVCHLLEQLPGADECRVYEAKYHRWRSLYKNASGCARAEAFDGQRSDHDMFSWLTSYHRHPPQFSSATSTGGRGADRNDVAPTCSKRQTSLDLPDAMRYRHLKDTTKQVAGVYRSGIHGRGLYCKKDIAKGEMIIEYSGEVIRSTLCDLREKYYESRGLGCYMFRMDNDQVVDATVKGNAARFINHSCDPNCYSKMITVDSKKHIVIYALREIRSGEELTYDYKFPIEDDKLQCTCGSRRCRKFMN